MASEETEAIARIMATGFNRHIREHGPDGDYAGEAVETGDGHGLVVTRRIFRNGFRVESEYGVRVEPLPAMTVAGPLTPGQCWAALKDHLSRQVEQDLKVHQEAVAAGDTASAASHGALVSANRGTLAKMRELEAGR